MGTNNQQRPYGVTDEMLAAFLDGNVSQAEANIVLSSLPADSELTEIVKLSPIIDEAIESRRLQILPMLALAAANPENMCSFDCETFILDRLGIDIDHWSLLETAKANKWVRDEGTPLHHVGRLLELKGLLVERKYDAEIHDLGLALDNGKQVMAVVDRKQLDNCTADGKNPSYHTVYITSVNDAGVKYLNPDTSLENLIAPEEFKKAWKCSGNYMVTASRDSNGYNPEPIDVGDIDLDCDLEELTEAIAENAHDIWARARMNEGWTYGPVRDDKLKHHPDLVPYSQLPDSEKEYDRIMAMNTLRLVRRLGYDIVKLIAPV